MTSHVKPATEKRLRVLLATLYFPSYRVPMWCKLAEHTSIDLTLVHNTAPGVHPGEVGLTNVTKAMPFRVIPRPFPRITWGTRSVVWCTPVHRLLKAEGFDVVIHDFRTRCASLGRTIRLQHRRDGKLILWGIGFSQKPTPLLDYVRTWLVCRADATVLHSEPNRQRYINMGVPAEKLFVARNSSRFELIDAAISQWSKERLCIFRQEHGLGTRPVLLHVGRMAEQKRLDLLLRAAVLLRQDYPGLKIALIGDGPHRNHLQEMSSKLGLGNTVLFPGGIDQEGEVAPWFLLCDLVVAPGQIGLLAMHAASYGRPLITSDNRTLHGPEVEVFVPGTTGRTYQYDNLYDLLTAIRSVLAQPEIRRTMGLCAYKRVRSECGVGNTANGVLKAIAFVTGRSLPLFAPYP